MESELDQPIWAVAGQTKVFAIYCTHAEAVEEMVLLENKADSGLAVITAEAAKRQLDMQRERGNTLETNS